MTNDNRNTLLKTLSNDYGMVFVLLLMVIVLSALTLQKHSPVGAEAGRLVAG